jgi:hypothetical protein
VISVPPKGGSRSQLRVRTASRPPAPFSETNNECQIKFELLQISLDVKQMGERSAGNLHAAFDAEGAGNVARSKRFGLNRRASPRPYLGAPGGEISPSDSTTPEILHLSGSGSLTQAS